MQRQVSFDFSILIPNATAISTRNVLGRTLEKKQEWIVESKSYM